MKPTERFIKLQHSFLDFNQPMGLKMNPDNRWVKMADRELVEQITENPYLQYFIGLPGYQEEAPFDASTLVLFRKRITAEMLMEANEYLLAQKDDGKNDDAPPSGGDLGTPDVPQEDGNKGTLTLDATCVPVNIRYPQDISLLNEARENPEGTP